MSTTTSNLGLFKYDVNTDANVPFSITEALNNNWDIIDEKCNGLGLPIGTIIPLNATSNYVPNGSLPCDGAEYSKSQFNNLWNNYLSTSLLNTCTYTKYEQDIATYGQCAKFAVDTVNNKFRVPLIKDGAVIQQALTDSELGKSYNSGLPNITGTIFSSRLRSGSNEQKTGAFSNSGSIIKAKTVNNDTADGSSCSIDFDASLSNTIYGNSETVQMNAVALRYFVVVANGQINQSMMDWSAWASSLQGKANTDLSNLSDDGKKVIDGQWVAKTETLSTATAVGTYTIDLSDYLPNDTYNYEISLTAFGWRDSGNTNTQITVSTNIIPSPVSDLLNYREASCFMSLDGTQNETDNNCCIIPIINSRKLYLQIFTVKAKGYFLFAKGYRRIGVNT